MKRGTKPSKWTHGASAGFAAYFARRSEPLPSPPEEKPLAEVTGAGLTLEGTPAPHSFLGKLIGLWVGIVAQAILGLFIAVGSVPLLGFVVGTVFWIYRMNRAVSERGSERARAENQPANPPPPHTSNHGIN